MENSSLLCSTCNRWYKQGMEHSFYDTSPTEWDRITDRLDILDTQTLIGDCSTAKGLDCYVCEQRMDTPKLWLTLT